MIFYPKITKFTVEVPAYKRRLDLKVEANRANCFQDMRDLKFNFFFFIFSQNQL